MTETRRKPWVSASCPTPPELSRTPKGHRLYLVERSCDFCGKPINSRRVKRYCDSTCAAGPRRAGQAEVDAWLAGELPGHTGASCKLKPWVRDWVLARANYSCEVCGWSERHPDDDRPLVEVDHVDGDAENTRPDNLKVLCPNHHAMTSTHRRRNPTSKRNRSMKAAVPIVGIELTTSALQGLRSTN